MRESYTVYIFLSVRQLLRVERRSFDIRTSSYRAVHRTQHAKVLSKMAAEALYHDIDNLELYVGLSLLLCTNYSKLFMQVGMQAEQAKCPMPGAGLCPGYTMSRAILADAVCLSRGDRFMTTEFTRMLSYGCNALNYLRKRSSKSHCMGLSRLSIPEK